MNNISYTFHISSKKNAITNKNKLSRSLNHNLRSYESKIYDKTQNEILIGSNNSKEAFQDFQNFYKKEFQNEIEEYNQNQTREDRKINDYFDNISKNSKTDIATEIIIQVGDMDFWENKTIEEKKEMTKIFKDQLDLLNKNCPNFKIINAVIHYDEKSPHLQILGVPIFNYEKGLKKRVAKTKVFTKESLEILQEKMREPILEQMKKIYGNEINLTAKEKGRNKDLFIDDYIEMKKNMTKEINEEIKKEYLPKIKKLEETIEEKKELLEKNKIAKTNLNLLNDLKNKKKKVKIKNNLFQSEEIEIYKAIDIEKTLENLKKYNFDIKIYQDKINELKIEKKAIYEDNLKNKEEINKLKKENDKLFKENKNLKELLIEIEKRVPLPVKEIIKTIKEIFKIFNGAWSKNSRDKELEKLDSRLGIKNNEKDKTLER